MAYRRQLVFLLLTAWLFVSKTQSQEHVSLGGRGRRKGHGQHAETVPRIMHAAPGPVALRGGCDVGSSHGVLGTERYEDARRLSKSDPPEDVSIDTKGDSGVVDGPQLSTEKREKVEANKVGVDQTLVPSYCPLRPFERYAALHHDILAGKAPPRYLVYRPYLYCGMGNRLRGFRGVLLLAMVTERALMVDWFGGVRVRDKLSYKFEDNFLQANGVPYSDFPSDLLDYEDASGTQIWCQMPKAVHLSTPCNESKITPDFLSTAMWDSVYASDAKVVLVQAHNSDPTVYLRENEDKDVVDALSKFDADVDADAFGRCAFRFLFKAKPEFQKHYCEERRSVLEGKFATVSMHIRTGDNQNYHPEWYQTLPQDIKNFVSCAAGLEQGLALVAANSSNEVFNFTDDPDFAGLGEGATDTVWLFGADSNDAIDLMNEGKHTVEFGGKVAYIEGDEFHRTHSGSKAGVAADNEGPLLDLVLLSESLLLVESYHSTFSASIAQIGGLPMPMRMVLKTPFARMFGSRMDASTLPSVDFRDFEEGCRNVVMDPNLRDYLELAVRASREPFISCEQDYGR